MPQPTTTSPMPPRITNISYVCVVPFDGVYPPSFFNSAMNQMTSKFMQYHTKNPKALGIPNREYLARCVCHRSLTSLETNKKAPMRLADHQIIRTTRAALSAPLSCADRTTTYAAYENVPQTWYPMNNARQRTNRIPSRVSM